MTSLRSTWTLFRPLFVLALLLPAGLLTGCEDEEPAAEADWIIEVIPNPASLDLSANGSGDSTITAVVFNEIGNPQSGIGVRFSTTASGQFEKTGIVQTNSRGEAVNVLKNIRADTDVVVRSGSVEGRATITIGAVNQKPTALVTISPPDAAPRGQLVNFSGAQSEDLDGVIVEYLWTIVSDNPDPGKSNPIIHVGGEGEDFFQQIFQNAQHLNVTLKVTDDKGDFDSFSTEYDIVANRRPKAVAGGPYEKDGFFNPLGQFICVVQVNGCASSDPDAPTNDIVTYQWDVSSGVQQFSSSCTTNINVNAVGDFTATLIVYDNGSDGSCGPFNPAGPDMCPDRASSDAADPKAQTTITCRDPNASP